MVQDSIIREKNGRQEPGRGGKILTIPPTHMEGSQRYHHSIIKSGLD